MAATGQDFDLPNCKATRESIVMGHTVFNYKYAKSRSTSSILIKVSITYLPHLVLLSNNSLFGLSNHYKHGLLPPLCPCSPTEPVRTPINCRLGHVEADRVRSRYRNKEKISRIKHKYRNKDIMLPSLALNNNY